MDEVNTGGNPSNSSGGFMDDVDTGGSSGGGSSGGNLMDSVTNEATSTASGFIERSLDSLGQSIKSVIDEQVAKRATDPIRDALGQVTGGLLEDFFDGFMDEGQTVPPQYNGTTNVDTPLEEYLHTDLYAMMKYKLNETNDAVNDSHPMMKYMFLADFVFDTGSYYKENHMKSFPCSMALSLKNTTFPKMEIETEEINQYNRHVHSPRRVRYSPITATFGESVDFLSEGSNKTSMVEVWEKLASFYVNDFKNADADFVDSPLGHTSGRDSKNILKYIDLYMIWPNSTKRIRIVNPFITSFSYDNLDYASDDQVQATFDIKYEYYQMVQVRGSFVNFINSTAGASIFPGSPYELIKNQTNRNIDVITTDGDQDRQRMINLDNDYAQATLELAEQKAIEAASSLLGSSDPVKRELGRQAVERSLDAGASIANGSGAFSGLGDIVEDLGRTAGRETSIYIRGLF